MKNWAGLLVSLAIGLVGAILVKIWLEQQVPEARPTDQATILIAAQDIEEGTTLRSDLMTTLAIPKEIYSDVFHTPADLKHLNGERVMYKIPKGRPVLAFHLVGRSDPGAVVPVVVAADKIDSGTLLGPEHLQVREFPKELVTASFLQFKEQARGKRLRATVNKGDPILISYLREEMVDVANQINAGMRAVTIQATLSGGVGGHLHPDHRVDVLVTVDWKQIMKGGPEMTELASYLVLQTRRILAVEDTVVEVQPDTMGAQKARQMQGVLVTLEVTPREAMLIGFLDRAQTTNRASVHLALRRTGDSESITAFREGQDGLQSIKVLTPDEFFRLFDALRSNFERK